MLPTVSALLMAEPKPSKLDDQAMIRASDGVLACELGGGAALLDTEAGVYFSLNRVGAAIWSQIERSATIAALLEFILDAFDVTEAVARRDLDALITSLADHGLIQIERP